MFIYNSKPAENHNSDETQKSIPEIHVVRHVLDNIMIQIIWREFVREGSRVSRPVPSFCDPGVLHGILEGDPLIHVWGEETLQQLLAVWTYMYVWVISDFYSILSIMAYHVLALIIYGKGRGVLHTV